MKAKINTALLVLALATGSAACGTSQRPGKTVVVSNECAAGSHLCRCYGNGTCDGGLTCAQPEAVCATETEVASDGGVQIALIAFQQQGTAGSGAVASSGRDAGSAGAYDDAGSPGHDAAVALTHADFAGNWSCTQTERTTASGAPLKTPQVSVLVVQITDAFNVTFSGIRYTFSAFDGETLRATQSSGVLALRLVDANTLQGSLADTLYPKSVGEELCTRV